MCNKKLDIGGRINVEDITIVPVTQISREGFHSGNSVHFFASKEPAAIIVFQEGFTKVYDWEGREISAEASSSADAGLWKLISGVLEDEQGRSSEAK